jgi:DNA modification methylase
VPCTVLDPFIGSGTTALVAAELGRNVIGIDINPEYIELARKRIPTTLWSTTQ